VGKQLVEVFLLVLAVAQLDTAVPYIIEATIQPDRGSADAVFIIWTGGKGLESGGVPAAEGVVNFRFATLIEHGDARFQRIIELVAETQRKRTVAVAIMIRITGERGPGAVDTGGFLQPGGQAEPGTLIATRQAQGTFPGTVTATGDADIGAQAFAFT